MFLHPTADRERKSVVINMGLGPVKHGTVFVNGFPFDFNISVILMEKLNNIKYPSN